MKDEGQIINFPKIHSPFVRVDSKEGYKCIDKIVEGYEWVFENPMVLAVDKLHGINICCVFINGVLQTIDNRTHRLMKGPSIMTGWKTEIFRVIEGVLKAIEKGWIEKGFTGRIYGELVGPTVNTNLHNLTQHYFVPFDYLKKHCKWNSWSANKYPKTFDAIKEWFKELPSLFSNRTNPAVTDSFILPAEGLVFYDFEPANLGMPRMAKLRRNMF